MDYSVGYSVGGGGSALLIIDDNEKNMDPTTTSQTARNIYLPSVGQSIKTAHFIIEMIYIKSACIPQSWFSYNAEYPCLQAL